jgi:hypothetical protein
VKPCTVENVAAQAPEIAISARLVAGRLLVVLEGDSVRVHLRAEKLGKGGLVRYGQ